MTATPPARKPWYRILYIQVLLAVLLGIAVGALWPKTGASLKPLGDGFVALVKMLIAPIIFCTLVHGIASMGDLKKLGRVGGKALLYFEVVSTLALVIGLVVVNWLQPGANFQPKAATKAEEGHDENITFERMAELLGNPIADRVRELSLALYQRGAQLAAERGILLADTKFEFGLDADGQLLLIDEALTPDSSRYWLADRWAPGQNPPSLDKQFLRDYLETIPGWDKQPPAPHLPEAVIEGIRARYLDLAGRFGVQL